MDKKKWYQTSIAELLQFHQVNPERGLSLEEVDRRRQTYGFNELVEAKRLSPILLFINQFKDMMIIVLFIAVVISALLGEFLDAVTIVAIITINGILGFIQEFRAEKSLHALKQLTAPMAEVCRGGKIQHIPAKELVPGDIIFLHSGDRIPADVRFIEVNGLYTEEAALTGESEPVSKHTKPIAESDLPLGDQRNIGFKGTAVTQGKGKAVVIRTGMETEMGAIAELLQNTETMQTPLQHRLDHLGRLLVVVALGLTMLVVLAGIMHGQPVYLMFLAGVTLAVAAIPEGLPAIVTIALALGVQRMIKRKAIVRKLPSVETLGCASVICSDKTGTMTQNKMTVTDLWVGGRMLQVTGDGYEPHGQMLFAGKALELRGEQALRRAMQISVLCNNAVLYHDMTVQKNKKNKTKVSEWKIKGDPTEGALIVAAAKVGMTAHALEGLYERTKEFPFDSERKRMSVIVAHQGGQLVCTKGAPDVLIDHCAYVMWEGKVVPLDATLKQKVLETNERMAKNALRVIGLAYRECRRDESLDDVAAVESQLIFAGLAGMIDPPRKEVRQAIATCRRAGIKTMMITGDHLTTAEAIASQLGMKGEGAISLTGQQIDALTDDQLAARVDHTYVYARVSPMHKLRIVKALQRNGHIVAMTGDGVNDAPAIKAADIGIAMGITGTDVSKEASALILTDDNFSSIVAAIEEGRSIYENIRKFIRYLLASNVGEILTMFIAMMLGMPLPLVPIQILWVNLVTDGLPAMALGVDQAESDLMQQKPRSAKENIFARRLGWKIISRGMLIGLCTLAAFWIVLQTAHGDEGAVLTKAQTVAFSTLVLAQLIHVFDCRSSRSIFHRNILENKYLVVAVISSLLLLLGVLYIEALQPIFKTMGLGMRDWILVFIFAGIPTFVMGIGSVFSPAKKKKTLRFKSKPMIR